MLIQHPTQFLAVIVIVALAVSFIYLLFTKWHVWEYLQIHADGWLEKITHRRTEFLNEAFSCIFCMGWWLSVIICVILLCITGDASYIIVPFCTVPIIRRMG